MASKPPTSAKARALSLHIGLNTVSASHYGGWTGPLAACEFDANDMAALATGARHEDHRAAHQGRDARQGAVRIARGSQGAGKPATSSSSPTPATAARCPT